MKMPTLRQVNNGLSLLVIGLCLYILLAPLWPQATLRLKDAPPLVVAEEKVGPKRPDPPPKENTLVVPRMKLQQTVFESQTGYPALNKGIWHHPQSGTPGRGKNTVLIGHRFTYGGPAVFYHLDRVRAGDQIVLYWQQKRHAYTVEKVLVVPPSATDIEKADVGGERLTIYTCTPLLTARDRLVIQATPLDETTEGAIP
ncbi:MAG TPA: class E sortase [Candidatus Limnocylindria bacterium]|nr:class E sortase [Candidatus Limnocylindria bacterium]